MNHDSIDYRHALSGGRQRTDERKQRYDSGSPRRQTTRSSSERRTSPQRNPTRKSPGRQRSHRRNESRAHTSSSPSKSSSTTSPVSPMGKQHDKRDPSRRKPPSRSRSEVPNTSNDNKPSRCKMESNPRRKVRSHRSSNELHQSMSTYTSKSTLSRSVSVDTDNNNILKFDVDAQRDPLLPRAETASVTTTSTDREMTPEQKSWAGIASVLHHGDASESSASASEVLPQQVLKALRGMRRNGSVVASLGTDPYALRVDDDDEESKATDSIHSSMPSLCDASIASLATSIISAFPPDEKNQLFVQSKPRDGNLRIFCSQLLGAVGQLESSSSSNESAIGNKEEMVSYLHHLLVSAYTKDQRGKPRSAPSTVSMDDSMPSLLDCVSQTETSGTEMVRSTNSILEDSIALEAISSSPIGQKEDLNSSMPSLLSCRTGDLDVDCATKWASHGDLDHIVEDEESSASSESTEENNVTLPTVAAQNLEKPIAKSPMRRSKTIDVPRPSPSLVKPPTRRAQTESIPQIGANSFDLEATPDKTFTEFIPNQGSTKQPMAQRREQRSLILKLFPRRRDLKNPPSSGTKPKAPVRTFRQRVSMLKFRNNELTENGKKKKAKSRFEERFFPKEEISEEFGGNLLLP